MQNQTIAITNGQDIRIVDIVAFAAGAYAGWTLAEGQHWAVKVLAGLVGGCGASALSQALV